MPEPESSTAASAEAALPASAPEIARNKEIATGRQVYERYCKLCHGAEATGYAADNAPSLVSRTFLESASDDFIAHGIRSGRPNTAMAAYGAARGGPLDEAQIRTIVTFLRSKGPAATPLPERPASGDAARGFVIFDRECKSCHGTPEQRGNALSLHNSELLASAPAEFLRHAIVNGRPPTPMPAFGGKLAPDAIEDVLSFLVSLKAGQPTLEPVLNPKVPDDLPLVINPNGGRPQFTLREGRFVPAAQVKRALDQKQRIVLVDARPPSDWIQFRIPGAVSLPYHDPEQLKRIPNDGTWVVAYCACPHHASGEVVDALRREKYPNTAVLDEGILVWRERGYDLVGEAVKANTTASPKKR